jgi:type VI secretion system protein ImpC
LPYGPKTDPVESFPFDELAPRTHEGYLWGNPAFACAQLAAAAVQQGGSPGDVLDLDDLPAHTYRQDGEPHLQACAEAFLGDRAAQAILARGLMPFASLRDRNAIRLLRFQSLSDPPTGLGF